VWSAPFIKPIDTRQVVEICSQNEIVVVLEEHSILGGLGSVVAEIASQYSPTRILRVGVNDRFSSQCGSYEYLLKEHGLDQASIEQTIQQFISGGAPAC
jgi:transketolase